MKGWESFFAAEASAAAALTGLVFVAVSINLLRVLELRHMPGRAAEALLILMSVLIVSTFGLVPDQSHAALGGEILGTGALVWLLSIRVQWRAFQDVNARPWLPFRVVIAQAACLPFVASGALLLTGHDIGIYLIVPGTLASFVAGVLNAWVLLVEIQR